MTSPLTIPPMELSDRYVVYGEIARGGMAVVQFGRLRGPVGFSRSVAIKRLHDQFARDPEFVAMFIEEARLAAQITHANVVATLDVVTRDNELSLIMEYVHGETLARLLREARARGESPPVKVAATLLAGVLHGLHAAHETRNERGDMLGIVHRDVSPDNIMVGADGVPRVLDFGIAKAHVRGPSTPSGEVKGKLSYMACEQLLGHEVDHRVDVYGAAVVLWEALAGRRLFDGPNHGKVVSNVLQAAVAPPSTFNSEVPPALDRIVLRGLSRVARDRFATAHEMALALEREVGVVAQSEVCDWVMRMAAPEMAKRAARIQELQEASDSARFSLVSARAPSTRRIPLESASSAVHRREKLMTTPALSSTGRRLRRRFSGWAGLAAACVSLALAGWYSGSLLSHSDKAERVGSLSRATSAGKPTKSAALTTPTASAQALAPSPHREQPAGLHLGDSAQAAESSALVSAPSSRAKSRRAARGEERRLAVESSPVEAAAPAVDPECSPPFIIDDLGIKRLKVQCL